MSLTPVTPNFSPSNVKGFWQRPEGKVGKFVLVALAGVTAFFAYSAVLPLLLATVFGTLQLVIGGVVLFALISLLTSKKVHRLISTIFKLTMRYLTGLVITIDPIGILEERLSDMRKRREAMGAQITNLFGGITQLRDVIKKNEKDAQVEAGQALEAHRRSGAAQSEDERQRWAAQEAIHARQSVRLRASNDTYQGILNRLEPIYSMLKKWATNIDFYITDTENEVKQQKIQYKVVNSAYSAYKLAVSMISGNADENEMYDGAMEFLAANASQKLGEIDEFQETAQSFIDSMDLKNASFNTDALAKLQEFANKTALPTIATSSVNNQIPQRTSSQDLVKVSVVGGDDYDDLIK
jgi:hypothetical protein